MKQALTLAAAALVIAFTTTGVARAEESTKPHNDSIKQGIKNDAAAVKQGVKRSSTTVKRRLAVAQCTDGAYSYTHTNTCEQHGGIKHRLH